MGIKSLLVVLSVVVALSMPLMAQEKNAAPAVQTKVMPTSAPAVEKAPAADKVAPVVEKKADKALVVVKAEKPGAKLEELAKAIDAALMTVKAGDKVKAAKEIAGIQEMLAKMASAAKKPEVKADTKPAVKTDAKPEIKADAKDEVKDEVKAEDKTAKKAGKADKLAEVSKAVDAAAEAVKTDKMVVATIELGKAKEALAKLAPASAPAEKKVEKAVEPKAIEKAVEPKVEKKAP